MSIDDKTVILNYLDDIEGSADSAAICETTGLPKAKVQNTLSALFREGQVQRVGRGFYASVLPSRAVRMWLNDDGWPDCERRALTGKRDTGDLTVCRRPLIIAEVKAGHAADKASPKVIADWLEQTDTEAVHAGAVLGVLIVARKYRNPRDWDAYMRACDWVLLLSGDEVMGVDAPWPMRASLADWSAMAKAWADS